jgi:hypothetical protein
MGRQRIMYIEKKNGENDLIGDARIGRVTFSKTEIDSLQRNHIRDLLPAISGLKHPLLTFQTINRIRIYRFECLKTHSKKGNHECQQDRYNKTPPAWGDVENKTIEPPINA